MVSKCSEFDNYEKQEIINQYKEENIEKYPNNQKKDKKNSKIIYIGSGICLVFFGGIWYWDDIKNWISKLNPNKNSNPNKIQPNQNGIQISPNINKNEIQPNQNKIQLDLNKNSNPNEIQLDPNINQNSNKVKNQEINTCLLGDKKKNFTGLFLTFPEVDIKNKYEYNTEEFIKYLTILNQIILTNKNDSNLGIYRKKNKNEFENIIDIKNILNLEKGTEQDKIKILKFIIFQMLLLKDKNNADQNINIDSIIYLLDQDLINVEYNECNFNIYAEIYKFNKYIILSYQDEDQRIIKLKKIFEIYEKYNDLNIKYIDILYNNIDKDIKYKENIDKIEKIFENKNIDKNLLMENIKKGI